MGSDTALRVSSSVELSPPWNCTSTEGGNRAFALLLLPGVFCVPGNSPYLVSSYTGINLFLACDIFYYFVLLPKGNEDISSSQEVLEIVQHVCVGLAPAVSADKRWWLSPSNSAGLLHSGCSCLSLYPKTEAGRQEASWWSLKWQHDWGCPSLTPSVSGERFFSWPP